MKIYGEARCEAWGKRRVEEGPGVEGPTQKKRLALGPWRGRLGGVTDGAQGSFLIHRSKNDDKSLKWGPKEGQH